MVYCRTHRDIGIGSLSPATGHSALRRAACRGFSCRCQATQQSCVTAASHRTMTCAKDRVRLPRGDGRALSTGPRALTCQWRPRLESVLSAKTSRRPHQRFPAVAPAQRVTLPCVGVAMGSCTSDGLACRRCPRSIEDKTCQRPIRDPSSLLANQGEAFSLLICLKSPTCTTPVSS